MPFLTVDGTVLAQSGAIVRFLAKRFNLNGTNDIEAAQLDGIWEALGDLRGKFRAATNPPDEAKEKVFWETDLPHAAALLEKNVHGSNHFGSSNTLSYADIAIYYFMWVLQQVCGQRSTHQHPLCNSDALLVLTFP
jgi:glutathione S-transferase